jgi:hypothetical protein
MSRVDWELLPDVLKTLSAKKGKLFSEAGKAHYALVQRNFSRNPEDLTGAEVEANAALAAVVVNNFNEVQQIWNELDHFAKRHKVKGEHPDFKAAAAKQKVSALSDVALLKLLRNIPSNILKYTKTRIPAATGEERRQALEQKVAAWRTELAAARAEATRRSL